MPRFLIEPNFAEEVEATKDIADTIIRINDEERIRWLFSFLSPRQAENLLPLRGAQCRGDPHRRPESQPVSRRGDRSLRDQTRDVRLNRPLTS